MSDVYFYSHSVSPSASTLVVCQLYCLLNAKGTMGDDDYDPNQDDDVASDHLDDEAPGHSKRKVTAAGGGKGDVSPAKH